MTATTTRRRSPLAIPRTRGLITGLCLIALGVWGGIIPFVGPYFTYAFINNHAWHFTWGRLWLDILPGVAVLLAGLVLLSAANRVTAALAGWLATAAGAWFVIGPEVSRLWDHGVAQTGKPIGGYVRQTVEWLGYHYALGAAVILLAAFAIGRVSVAAARDVLAAEGGRTWWRPRRTARGPAAPATAGTVAADGAAANERADEPVTVRRAEERQPVATRTGADQSPAEG
jgi:hypothetical protein